MVGKKEVEKFKDPGNSHYDQQLQGQNLSQNFHLRIFVGIKNHHLFSLLMVGGPLAFCCTALVVCTCTRELPPRKQHLGEREKICMKTDNSCLLLCPFGKTIEGKGKGSKDASKYIKILFFFLSSFLLRTWSAPNVSVSPPFSGCVWLRQRRRDWRGRQPELSWRWHQDFGCNHDWEVTSILGGNHD